MAGMSRTITAILAFLALALLTSGCGSSKKSSPTSGTGASAPAGETGPGGRSAQPGDRQERGADRRSLCAEQGRQGGDGEPRHGQGSRQRGRLQENDQQLPLAVSPLGKEIRSLYVEPERSEQQIDWQALQFHDV